MGKVKQLWMDKQEEQAEELRKLHPDWDDEQIWNELNGDAHSYEEQDV